MGHGHLDPRKAAYITTTVMTERLTRSITLRRTIRCSSGASTCRANPPWCSQAVRVQQSAGAVMEALVVGALCYHPCGDTPRSVQLC
jgi:hypothetical protein